MPPGCQKCYQRLQRGSQTYSPIRTWSPTRHRIARVGWFSCFGQTDGHASLQTASTSSHAPGRCMEIWWFNTGAWICCHYNSYQRCHLFWEGPWVFYASFKTCPLALLGLNPNPNITIDWNEILSKLKVSSFDACSSTEVDYQDSSDTYFFGSLGYDDLHRKLMSKRIRTMNNGDEMQGLAGIQMLPRVDAFVERDVLHQAKFATPSLSNNSTDKIVMFWNAWYGILAMIWPPPDFLEPVTLAMLFKIKCTIRFWNYPMTANLSVKCSMEG